MEAVEKLSLRVYGCCVHQGKILLLKEKYAGENLIKFPGGGLELGEGIADCLRREIREELGVPVAVHNPIHTVDYFLRSRFHPDTQIILMYYAITFPDGLPLHPAETGVEILWAELNAAENPMSLETDRVVFEILRENRDQELLGYEAKGL